MLRLRQKRYAEAVALFTKTLEVSRISREVTIKHCAACGNLATGRWRKAYGPSWPG